MAQTSFALLTNVGRAKEAAALANASTIEITHIAIGDGATVPSGGETALYHELTRRTISGHGTVAGSDNVAYFDCYLAAGDGPYTIREAGLYDSAGDLIAIAHYDPPINKPVPASGQTVEGTVRLEVAFSSVATVVIVVDPSMQVALQRLTRLPWVPVIELGRNAPPASPVPGDTYVIGQAPTGSWAGHAGKLAEFTIAGWALMAPPDGHGVGLPDGSVHVRIGGAYVERGQVKAAIRRSGLTFAPSDQDQLAKAVRSQRMNWVGAFGGSSDALTCTLDPAPASLAELVGMPIRGIFPGANTGPVTLAVNALAATAVTWPDGTALRPGDLRAAEGEVAFDGTAFRLMSIASPDVFGDPRAVPIYPEITTGGGVMTITTGGGQVVVAAGQSWVWRGLTRISTDDFAVAARTFATVAAKTYHLIWDAPGTGLATPAASYPRGRFALIDRTGASPAETDASYDTTYDRMLSARVVTDGANAATVTSLLNKARLAARWSRSIQTGTGDARTGTSVAVTLNWARLPSIVPSITLRRLNELASWTDMDTSIQVQSISRYGAYVDWIVDWPELITGDIGLVIDGLAVA